MRFPVVVLLVIVLCLLPLGCGEDDSSSGSPANQDATEHASSDSAHLSDSEFRRRVSEICSDLRTTITGLSDRYFSPAGSTAKDVSGFARRTAPELQTALSRLGDLRPPKEFSAEVNSLERAVAQGTAALRTAAESPAGAKELLRGNDPLAGARRVAQRIGLRACAFAG